MAITQRRKTDPPSNASLETLELPSNQRTLPRHDDGDKARRSANPTKSSHGGKWACILVVAFLVICAFVTSGLLQFGGGSNKNQNGGVANSHHHDQQTNKLHHDPDREYRKRKMSRVHDADDEDEDGNSVEVKESGEDKEEDEEDETELENQKHQANDASDADEAHRSNGGSGTNEANQQGGDEDDDGDEKDHLQCAGYNTIDDLTEPELYPWKGSRHMVTPPKGGMYTLVCCSTTKGPLSIAVHHKWAPLGAQRFVDMVTSGYFQSVPFMRCMEDFLCQFGISDSAKNNNVDHPEFQETIRDDPPWLPSNKGRDQHGVARFAYGYMAYAGNGTNSRDKQVFVTLDDSSFLGGTDESPWEVPWGELVGKHSYETIEQIYTGYGDEYPDQEDLEEDGMTEEMRQQYPLMDYVQKCQVLDIRVIGEKVSSNEDEEDKSNMDSDDKSSKTARDAVEE